jgi:hypothetical protein
MSNHWDKSSDECIDPIILEKQILGSLVFLRCDEDIFAVFREKRLAEELPEYIVVEECSYD